MIGQARGNEVPVVTRLFVGGFLGLFLACGLLGVDTAWPLTGWRLFSVVREETEIGWEAVAVDGGGREQPVPFDSLPRGYHGSLQIMQGMGDLSASDRRGVCQAWARAVEDRNGTVSAIRVYRAVRDVRDGRERSRELRFECRRDAGW